MLEQRYIKTEIRLQKKGRTASGYAATFHTLSKRNSGLPFLENLEPGCFRTALQTGDPYVLLNHDTSAVLGRKSAGTARFEEDRNGLRYEVDLPESPLGENVRCSIERGDLDSCSWGFEMSDDPDDQSWDEGEGDDGERAIIRTLKNVRTLREISFTPFPAYPNTSASVRSLFPTGAVPYEIRSRYPNLVLPTLDQIAAVERDELLHRIKKSFV